MYTHKTLYHEDQMKVNQRHFMQRINLELQRDKILQKAMSQAFKLRNYPKPPINHKPSLRTGFNFRSANPKQVRMYEYPKGLLQSLEHTYSRVRGLPDWQRQLVKVNGYHDIKPALKLVKNDPEMTMAEAFQKAFKEIPGPQPRYLEQINRNIIQAIELKMGLRLSRIVKSMNQEVGHIVRQKFQFVDRRKKKFIGQALKDEKDKFADLLQADNCYMTLNSFVEVAVDKQLTHFERTIGEFVKVMPYTRYMNKELIRTYGDCNQTLKRLITYIKQ